MIAAKFSLSTWKTGYGDVVSRPHPTEGRVALRAGLHGHLPRLRAGAGRWPEVFHGPAGRWLPEAAIDARSNAETVKKATERSGRGFGDFLRGRLKKVPWSREAGEFQSFPLLARRPLWAPGFFSF